MTAEISEFPCYIFWFPRFWYLDEDLGGQELAVRSWQVFYKISPRFLVSIWLPISKSEEDKIKQRNSDIKSQPKTCQNLSQNFKWKVSYSMTPPHHFSTFISFLKENKLTKTVTLPSEHRLVYQWNSCMICLLEPPPTWKRECENMVICGTPFKMFFKNKFQNPITFFRPYITIISKL